MLTELLEALMERFKTEAKEAVRLAETGERPPPEYWRGYAMSLRQAVKDIRKAQRKAERQEEMISDHLDRVADLWLGRTMDLRDEAGAKSYAGDVNVQWQDERFPVYLSRARGGVGACLGPGRQSPG